MDPSTAVILGVLQGIFEWLPVSSEAVISLVLKNYAGSGNEMAVNSAVFLHTGTMLAALLYFREEFGELLNQIPEYVEHLTTDPSHLREPGLMNFLVISTVFTGIVGLPVYLLLLEYLPSRTELFSAAIGVALLATGALKLAWEGSGRGYMDSGLWDSIAAGGIQGLSVIPGFSRSGSTVFMLLYRDFSSEDAFKLSFLMSVPAVLVAQIGIQLFSGFRIGPGLVLASAVAFVVGYASIDAVLGLAERFEVAYIAFALGILSFLPLIL